MEEERGALHIKWTNCKLFVSNFKIELDYKKHRLNAFKIYQKENIFGDQIIR